MSELVALIVLLLAAFILWGICVSVQRLGRGKLTAHSSAIGIGLAVLIFFGAFLNLAHIAHAATLWTLAGLGLVLAVMEIRRLDFLLSNVLVERA
jgi:hypothetical protein